jgi:hypothetical protein
MAAEDGKTLKLAFEAVLKCTIDHKIGHRLRTLVRNIRKTTLTTESQRAGYIPQACLDATNLQSPLGELRSPRACHNVSRRVITITLTNLS